MSIGEASTVTPDFDAWRCLSRLCYGGRGSPSLNRVRSALEDLEPVKDAGGVADEWQEALDAVEEVESYDPEDPELREDRTGARCDLTSAAGKLLDAFRERGVVPPEVAANDIAYEGWRALGDAEEALETELGKRAGAYALPSAQAEGVESALGVVKGAYQWLTAADREAFYAWLVEQGGPGVVTPPVTESGATSVTSPVTDRLCACGCGQPITSPRPEARYATGACRVRAHRAR